ncbi:hypothetical protein D915_009333 [Fasciola hepatica]|uniref:Uncharacterized protein n=1 Tax=Fasciola hepatica TaxID=6192 RepID=A0A4E0RDQ9_FASHE|nr:hypothetical protein D915_009333 [Fasciola hepatica]
METKKLKHPRGWDHSATNILGTKRQGMCTNILHQRSVLGKCGTHCLITPDSSFTYGIKSVKNAGVPDAMCWSAEDKKDSVSSDRMEWVRDFIALNCESIQAGVTNAKELKMFRASHDTFRSKQKTKQKRAASAQDVTFGIKNRPSTPLADILGNRFQENWIAEQQQRLKKREDKESKRHLVAGKTRAQLLRSTQKPTPVESMWKLPEFEKKARPGVSTFRDEACRTRALRAYELEMPSRVGRLGQGIYRLGETN